MSQDSINDASNVTNQPITNIVRLGDVTGAVHDCRLLDRDVLARAIHYLRCRRGAIDFTFRESILEDPCGADKGEAEDLFDAYFHASVIVKTARSNPALGAGSEGGPSRPREPRP